MEAILTEVSHLLERGQSPVLATIVRTWGSTPQKAGAKYLVRPDGSTLGTLGGGCVEAEVWQEAMNLLRRGGEVLRGQFTLSDELAAESGMVCGGAMEVLIDATWGQHRALAERIAQALEGGRGAALASVVQVSGPGQSLGDKLLVGEEGTTQGTLGDSSMDSFALSLVERRQAQGGCELAAHPSGTEVFVETFLQPPSLAIAGAGHIGLALCPLAKRLGWRVTVIDDRADFANKDRFPEAAAVIAGDIPASLRGLPSHRGTFVVVATRGHKDDETATLEAARSAAGYIGLVGSKRKVVLIYKSLLAQGVPFPRLAAIHAPVGLDIGARTPEEIALSILAEMTMVRLGGKGVPLRVDERLALPAAGRATA
ncbi:MAG: XdhC family protein [Chloroflexota bacterium]|nr:XdhC family protein [Chloroflexota bacterium]